MALAATALPPGQVLGGCRVERLIARGELGALYAATELDTGAPRALKVIATGSSEGVEAARRFEHEARHAARLRHPDIVAIHGAGTEAGLAWLVMDLLAGCDLSRYTLRARLLPEPVVLKLGARISHALAHAHAQGVVHRDLKPANVMVDWAQDRVTLTDFGIARMADAERTRTGLVLGSPSYMAPELLAGQPASASTDLYALGVMLYQLMTGALPFDTPALGELLRQVAQQPAPDLRVACPAASPALAALLARLLAKAPAQRPASAQALAEELGALSGA